MVHVESLAQLPSVEARIIEGAVRETLGQQAAAVDVTIVLSDDAHLRDLNRKYLGIDAPTDVLSFTAAETDPETGRAYLGDVVISVPQAVMQAGAAGHPLESEIQLLVVHGVLHLLGHDHAEPQAKASMWAAQAAVLQRLGLQHLVIGE
jgi:probable rRNA maturation factor